ncbi:MAG: acyltransferase [Gammaproteobacteria bacterium]
MYSFDDYKLAETSDLIEVETREDNHLAAVQLAQQCQRNLEITSRDLDPAIFDTPDFAEAVKRLALKSKHAQIRILVFEPGTIVRRGHRLINLAENLSSFIELRKPGIEHRDYNELFLIADGTGYLHRKNTERFEGEVNFNDKRQSKHLLHQFEEMWETASPDPNLRRVLV